CQCPISLALSFSYPDPARTANSTLSLHDALPILPTGTVSFAAGETSKLVTVNVAGDTTVETDETFTVTLSAPSAGTITTAAATSTEVHTAAPQSLTTTVCRHPHGNSDTTPAPFTV